MLFKRYSCVMQYDKNDCGAACIATVARHYGLKISVARIREMAGTDRSGTKAFGLIQALKELGFDTRGVKLSREELSPELSLPAIANVITDDNRLHYVVIHKISQDMIWVADPGKGITRFSRADFNKIWQGTVILIEPGSQFKKDNYSKGLYRRFFQLLTPYKKQIVLMFVASLVFTILGIAGAFFYKILVDYILPQNLQNTLHVLALSFIGLNLLRLLLNAYRWQLLLFVSQKLDLGLMLGYYKHVLHLPMRFYSSRRTGEIIARFNDAFHVREAISSATLTIMIDTLMVLAGGIILFAQNSVLFLITVIMVILYTIIIYAFLRPFEKINKQEMECNAQLTSYLVESINGVETVKAFNAENKAHRETENRFQSLLKTLYKSGFMRNSQEVLKGFVKVTGEIVILWVGSYYVLQGKMSIGQLFTFNALLVYFLNPLENLINLQPTVQTAVIAAERLGEILDLETEESQSNEKSISPSLLGSIELRDVYYRFGFNKPVLRGINLKITQGEKIALVGESGSGKTTLVKLLMRFYHCEQGTITINNTDIKDINLMHLREKIAYVPQDVFLFSSSIKENLCMGNENIRDEELIEIARVTEVEDLISSQPLQFDSVLAENGSNLSGGQKQRLAIARAILKKPDILILDEATSNLDYVTEKNIENTIHHLCKGITTIIIAHRLSTIMKCDKICVLHDGEIVESGTHLQLLELKGKYYELWKEQFL